MLSARLRDDRARLVALLGVAAIVFVWRLSVSGYANSYYSAAALAGSESWKAMFFGSLDPANAITVDKPPFALWPMAVSVRLLGLSSWSILLPQAIEGVASVALLYSCVRRATGSTWPALIAGLTFVLTPVTVLVFRYNNPDAMLTLLLLGAAAATLRALDSRRATWWLAVAGTLSGFAFLTKMLEAFLVVPALALIYALYGQASALRRARDLVAAGAAVVVSAGWWVAIVELWPATNRPFIGGSPANSVLELALGYNGVQRLTGGAGTAHGIGESNIARIGRTDLAGEITWLLPAAIALGVLAWILSREHPRRSTIRPALVLWSTWLAVAAATFAAMSGIFHSYYTVVLAPAISALVSIGAWLAWEQRAVPWVRRTMAAVIAVTTLVAAATLTVNGADLRWTAVPVLVGGLASAVLLHPRSGPQHLGALIAVGVLTAALAGPALFAEETVRLPHVGSGPMAGPDRGATTTALLVPSASDPTGYGPVSRKVVSRIAADDECYTWDVVALGARTASTYELALEEPVLAVGGYKGTDPSPTLPRFQSMVRQRQVHWFVTGGTEGDAGRTIENWVRNNFAAVDVDGTRLYDLSVSGRLAGAVASGAPNVTVRAPRPRVGLGAACKDPRMLPLGNSLPRRLVLIEAMPRTGQPGPATPTPGWTSADPR